MADDSREAPQKKSIDLKKSSSTHSLQSHASNDSLHSNDSNSIAIESKDLTFKRKHKSTLSPATAQYLSNHSLSFPDIDLTENDLCSLSEKKKRKNAKRRSMQKWKRTISSDNLLNTGKIINSYGSRAITKMKNKGNEEIHTDSTQIKQSKHTLESFNNMKQILNTSKKLHAMQLKHIQSMNHFSQTIHSTIDLGRNRGASNTNYFGQYLKMMASTLTSNQHIYTEFASNFNEFIIEPFEDILMDENSSDGSNGPGCAQQLQQCKNYRYEYSKIKHSYNNNANSKNKLELQQIEKKFVHETNKLIQQRQELLMRDIMSFEQCFVDFSSKQSKYINEKRVINGYDEMKQNKKNIKNQIQKEMLYVNSDQQFHQYLSKYDHDHDHEEEANENKENKENMNESISEQKKSMYAILLFHRNKFPPSMQFLMDTFAPVAAKYKNNKYIEFINIDHKCSDILDQYNVNSFPTCLVFINGTASSQYKPIIGNGQNQSDELHAIVQQIYEKVEGPNTETRRMAVDRQMF